MADNNVFPRVEIKKYMYKTNVFFNMIHIKQKLLLNNISIIKNLFKLNLKDTNSKFKIILYINSLYRKYQLFSTFSKRLKYNLLLLIELEKSYGIDHNYIHITNNQRALIGQKSEYHVKMIFEDYIKLLNGNQLNGNQLNGNQFETIKKGQYFYEININIIKLLNIKLSLNHKIKGELDGVLIYFDGTDYIIEKIIEVKSSVKSTFEDFSKFIFLQNYLCTLNFEKNIIYKNFIFTKKSFEKIINQNMNNWTIYICITIAEKKTFGFRCSLPE